RQLDGSGPRGVRERLRVAPRARPRGERQRPPLLLRGGGGERRERAQAHRELLHARRARPAAPRHGAHAGGPGAVVGGGAIGDGRMANGGGGVCVFGPIASSRSGRGGWRWEGWYINSPAPFRRRSASG